MTKLNVDWYIKDHVVLVTVASDFLAITDIQQVNDAILEHFRASEASTVHLILDGHHIEKFQMNIALIGQTLTFMREAKLGWMLLLSDDKMLNLTATIVAQVAHSKLRNASSVEDAARYLKRIDPRLDLP